jgi:peptidoglycan/xylan/chitin deacetylase (PgdA/CDA1 family)
MVLWSVDGHDWEYDDPNRVAAAVLDHVTPGSIVLLHDTNAVTARALPAIIEGLRRDGYSLVPVSELTGVVPYRPGREPSPPAATADDR